jgi:hypothetical protein
VTRNVVTTFLEAHAGASFCTSCLDQMIRFEPARIEETAQGAGSTQGLTVRVGTCSNCEKRGIVIGVAPPPDADASISPVTTPYCIVCDGLIQPGTGRFRTPAGEIHPDCYERWKPEPAETDREE